MPQVTKGGKFIFGWSKINKDLTIQLPQMAIDDYDIIYKGRLYCWLSISRNGVLQFNDKIVDILSLKVNDKLLSIRSSDIAFTMGVKGPLIERSENFKGDIETY